MPELKLTTDELPELKQALDNYLHSLRVELARADIREFKDQLRQRIERLEAIDARLEIR